MCEEERLVEVIPLVSQLYTQRSNLLPCRWLYYSKRLMKIEIDQEIRTLGDKEKMLCLCMYTRACVLYSSKVCNICLYIRKRNGENTDLCFI